MYLEVRTIIPCFLPMRDSIGLFVVASACLMAIRQGTVMTPACRSAWSSPRSSAGTADLRYLQMCSFYKPESSKQNRSLRTKKTGTHVGSSCVGTNSSFKARKHERCTQSLMMLNSSKFHSCTGCYLVSLSNGHTGNGLRRRTSSPCPTNLTAVARSSQARTQKHHAMKQLGEVVELSPRRPSEPGRSYVGQLQWCT